MIFRLQRYFNFGTYPAKVEFLFAPVVDLKAPVKSRTQADGGRRVMVNVDRMAGLYERAFGDYEWGVVWDGAESCHVKNIVRQFLLV